MFISNINLEYTFSYKRSNSKKKNNPKVLKRTIFSKPLLLPVAKLISNFTTQAMKSV
ncbi:hypothetical protein FC28_GL000455 [Lactobacillus crispatus DSM 20584 = JCM 1185 = ATCC 33820]|nr:hypothetical protein FC28_GL000455 [Lactobacillus crispatus DSM 20584 = JCM 1185 = ATCC 33820]